MFCPKCGNTLPDGAAFCGGCGNKIATAEKPVVADAAGGQAGVDWGYVVRRFLFGRLAKKKSVDSDSSCAVPAANSKLSSMQIATIVVAAVSLLFAFLPWFETSSTLLSYGGGADFLSKLGSSFTGKEYGSFKFDESYSPWAFFDLANSAGRLPRASIGIPSIEGPLDTPCGFTELFWMLGVGTVVIGLIVMLVGAKRSVATLIKGSAILGLTSIAWNFVYPSLVSGGYAKGWPFNALLCGVACIGVILLAITSKKSQSI